MSIYRLDQFFSPKSLAIVGASERPRSLGGAVLQAVRAGGFAGPIFPVNPKYGTVAGMRCYPTIAALPDAPDLVIIATPAQSVVNVIANAIEARASTAIILTAGLGHGPGSIADEVLARARSAGLRIVGPNCLGLLSPRSALNASFAGQMPKPGPLALISQSGAIATGIVAWAVQRDIGFSGIVSLGDAIDVDVGDCLDYFAEDQHTRAILLYVEGITDARKFMSAARKAARVKPVIAIKGGRHKEGAKAAATHTGALAGSDAVYDAAFRRAGIVRALTLDSFFAGATALATGSSIAGDRIAVLTNGGGLGVLSVDLIADRAGMLAELTTETVVALDAVLPPTWSRANPVDIIGDAPAARYSAAMEALLADKNNDAILVMHCPTALTSPSEAADAVIASTTAYRNGAYLTKPVFSVWLGSDTRQQQTFQQAGIAGYETESPAVDGLMHMIDVHRGRKALLQLPPRPPVDDIPDRNFVFRTIANAIADNREWLTPPEISTLLDAYFIPATPVRFSESAEGAAEIAEEFLHRGSACAIKIQSRDIVHKSDIDGVKLGLTTKKAVRDAADDILTRAARLRPEARIEGVTIQPMIVKPQARELIVGVTVDPTFGPVILFGHGGTAVEVIDDKALALLPLDIHQARTLMEHTRVSRLLAGYRNVAPANTDRIAALLVSVSRLIEDNPEIVSMDLNPVLADADSILALDARVQVKRFPGDRFLQADRRFAVRPYPRHLEEEAKLRDGRLVKIRPLRPADQQMLTDMVRRCTPEDLRMRFFSRVKNLDPVLLARLTQLDYAREMAFVMLDSQTREILGVVRIHGDANGEKAEYAILIRSDLQGAGMGYALMKKIITFAEAEGYRELFGSVMQENVRILAMCNQLGFSAHSDNDDPDMLIARRPIR